jgi:hypothetical protein
MALSEHRAYWLFNLYPQAAEGGGCFMPTLRPKPGIGPAGPDGGPADVVRSQAEAARRARAGVRRFCAANRLNRLGTLTYAGEGCFDPLQLRAHLAGFFRALRRSLGGEPLPYLWVPEWHPGGHGLHAHFALAEFVPVRLVRAAWGRGFVSMKLIGDLPVGSGTLEEPRTVAGYLAPYVSKSFGEERVPGLHRYEVAQGFKPERVQLAGISDEDVIAQASELMGSDPVRFWRSSEAEEWHGSPAYWCAWAE